MLPLLFLVPIILGVKGSKQRSINGFYMSMSIVPMGLMTGITWIRYGYQAMQNFNQRDIQLPCVPFAMILISLII